MTPAIQIIDISIISMVQPQDKELFNIEQSGQ